MKDYTEFLERKMVKVHDSGFEVPDSAINPMLFPFQKFVVKRALKAGRYALFEDCGLGKTAQQIEWAHHVAAHTGKPVLILCPLAVAAQTIREGAKFGRTVRKLERDSDVGACRIWITNYEQLDNVDVSQFSGIVLDESSILKNFTGKQKTQLIEAFKDMPYRLCCTATPAPNDLNEIGNHSEFLGVMDSNDVRMRWFVRDEGMNNYRLKGHAHAEFYGWISTWATVIRKPSDIGFEDEGYELPGLNYFESVVATELKTGSTTLFNGQSVNATEFNKELRVTLVPRMDAVAAIVNESCEPWIIWVNQDAEEDAVCKLVPDAVAVRGSMTPERKSELLIGFANGDFRVLVTKKRIAQFGLNYQHCRNQVFAALDFSFEGLYQAIRRSYRFGQQHAVNIWLITTDTMLNVLDSINRKQSQFNEMMDGIVAAANGKAHGLRFLPDYRAEENDNFRIYNRDCVEGMRAEPDQSWDFSVFSPPFSTLFTYSDFVGDMGNCSDDAEFFQQMRFMLVELYRLIRNGRLVAVHTKDLPRYKGSSGYAGMYDFTGDFHREMERVGFKYHSKITIWTDPVMEMERTNTHRLLYKNVTSDSSVSGAGMAEYLTIFRKWEGDESEWVPITNKTKANFPLDLWQKWASPVWMDIKRTDVLNGPQGSAMGDEKHICPLQLSVIERAIAMWSNKGEVIGTPFLGIGSEVYQALKMDRRGIGFELKESYFDAAVKNCRNAVESKRQLSLF